MKAITRVGGNIDLLRQLIAAGFPVIVESGFQPPHDAWMGHYLLLTGYDDEQERFITQDTYIMADFPVPYRDLSDRWWRDFNYVYLVIYPLEKEAEVLAIIGTQLDPVENYRQAALMAAEEIEILNGRDLFFAWFNLGSNRLELEDPAGAAQAYDQAFLLYARLPEEERPWRNLWYQQGPYQAYYETGRYQDVITLADQTLFYLGKSILEESLYWRGLAKEALGDREGAIADLKKAAEINPISTDALIKLEELGITSP